MRRSTRYLSFGALTVVLLARVGDASPNPCRAACTVAKKSCLHAADTAFRTAKGSCTAAPEPAERRACKRAAGTARAAAKATCKTTRVSCVAQCDTHAATTTTTIRGATTTVVSTTRTTTTSTTSSTSTSTSTTLPGPTCGDVEGPGLRGVTWAHDAVRADPALDGHGVPQPAPSPPLAPLCYSASVASVAQAWADGCVYMHNAGRGSLGENIYATTRAVAPQIPVDAVTLWAAEAEYYDYADNTCAAPNPPGTCLHYTQIVWRSTTSVGCGIKACTTNSPFPGFSTWTFVVCDYAPPGNVSVCDLDGQCVLQLPY